MRKEAPVEFSRKNMMRHATWLKLTGAEPADWKVSPKMKYENFCQCCGAPAFVRFGKHCYCEKHKNVGRAQRLRFMREHGKKVGRIV
jgi:hypothetical protein